MNARDFKGATPLHRAYGDDIFIITLLQAGADINARDRYGETLLHFVAVRYDDSANIIPVLLGAGADINARDRYGMTLLHSAAKGYFDSANIITALLQAGADINALANEDLTPLHLAAARGTSADVIALLDAGADGSTKDKYGRTPFYYAEDDDFTKINNLKGTDAYWALHDAQYD